MHAQVVLYSTRALNNQSSGPKAHRQRTCVMASPCIPAPSRSQGLSRNNQGTGILTGPTASHYAISGCKLQYNGVAAVLDGDNFAVTGNVLLGNKVGLKVADVKTSNNSVIANNVL